MVVAAVTSAPAVPDVAAIQRRTLRLLFCTQIIGGIGVTFGVTVGALLAARLAGTALSGVASSSAVVGGALLAVPATRLMRTGGRRPGLVLAYLCGAAGAAIVVVAALTHIVALLFAGMFLFGGGTTANLQARYTAADLAEPARRGRQLSIIVWATTIGAISAPNLASWADSVLHPAGVPSLAGPFAFSVVAFCVNALALFLLLRPDPLRTAMTLAADPGPANPGGAPAVLPEVLLDPAPDMAAVPARTGLREAARVVLASPAARLGVAAVAVGHLVMVGVMSMTPVRLGQIHHGDVLRIVGVVLSLHIVGMYAFSPIVGVLTDRLGRKPVIVGGILMLVAACAVAGTAGHNTVRLAIGLAMIGLGWSGTMVGGSTLLTESVPTALRPSAQGLSDLTMGVAGASSGALSGVIVQYAGYPTLTLLAAIATVPLVALVLRPGVPRLGEGGATA